MGRINVRDVPDDVYVALVEAADRSRQSLNSYVVAQLAEAARASRVGQYLDSYAPPAGSGVSVTDVAAAVREVREAS